MLLTTIVFLPLVGAVLVLLAGGRGDRPEREGTVRTLALAVSLVAFAATLLLWWRFNPGTPASSSSSAGSGCRSSASPTTSAWTASACSWSS
jgi:NADH:ubiquinone oxidoreductase subunit 4 (subunit M)